jgi:ketosteroid isomerase-like protein
MGEQQDFELLREAFGEWGRGEFTRVDMFQPDAELVIAGPDPRSYHGREGVRQGWLDFLSAWNDFRAEAREIVVGATAGTYLVLLHLSGRGKESSVPTEAEGANVVLMRDGKIARFEMFWDLDDARSAAGLRPREAG